MLVEVKETCVHTGIKEGEVYQAERYSLDPASKAVLLARVPDGFNPECTEYFHNLRIIPTA